MTSLSAFVAGQATRTGIRWISGWSFCRQRGSEGRPAGNSLAAKAVTQSGEGRSSTLRTKEEEMRRTLFAAAALAVVALCAAPTAGAAPLTVSSPVNVSILSPFPPGCGGPTEGAMPGLNFNYENAETEPWLAVSPTNSDDVAGM